MNNSNSTATRQPSHEEITHRARELWEQYGCPSDQDEKIWLEAEQQLLGLDATSKELSKSPSPTASPKTDVTEIKIDARPKMLRTTNTREQPASKSSRKAGASSSGSRRSRA